MEHAFAGDVQAQMLLILQRAHRGERTELMMQGGYAHASHGGELLDAERFGVIQAEPFDGLRRAMALLPQGGDCAEMFSLRAAEQAIDDFALDQAAEEWNVAGRIEKVHEADTRVEEFDAK